VSLRHVIGLVLLATGPAQAQARPALELQLGPAGARTEGPSVSANRVLDDQHVRELLSSSFPAELHFRLELWRLGGVFNELESATAWDIRVQYDPYSKRYRVARRHNAELRDLGSFGSLAEAQAEVEKPFRVPLTATHAGQRYYYSAVLDVQLLQVSDLDEMQSWLRGDLKPAVQGKGNPFSAIKNGLGRLLSRILGGEKRNYKQQSPIFTAE
jgi:hypothetical protein